MFVSVVHPVSILSAVFCVSCSLLMFVSDASGDHMVETYSSMGLAMALYLSRIVSFCFLHVIDVSALSIYIVLRAFVVMISMCLVFVSLRSRVSPSILGLMLSICSSSCVLYYAVSGVKRVHVVWVHNQTFRIHSEYLYSISLNLRRSSKVQGRVKREHCNICAVFSASRPHAHVVSPLK